MRVLVIVVALLLAGCGSGDSSGPFCTTERPQTSNLILTPDSAVIGDGGGTIDVSVTFDYRARDERISRVYYQIFDASGARIVDSDFREILRGSGTFTFDIPISTQSAETYTIRIRVTDDCLDASRPIEATFEVRMIAGLTGVTGYATAHLNSLIYFIGGRDNSGYVSDTLLLFDPATEELVFKAAMPEARESAASTAYNGTIYVFGGQAYGIEHDSTFAYDTETDAWTAVAPMFAPIAGAKATTIDGIIYVEADTGLSRYDPVLDLWTREVQTPGARLD